MAGGRPEKSNPVMMAITSGPGVQKTLNFEGKKKEERPRVLENVRKTLEKLRKSKNTLFRGGVQFLFPLNIKLRVF